MSLRTTLLPEKQLATHLKTLFVAHHQMREVVISGLSGLRRLYLEMSH